MHKTHATTHALEKLNIPRYTTTDMGASRRRDLISTHRHGSILSKKTLFDHFPVYAITLPERSESLHKRLSGAGITYEIIEAIDWRNKPAPDNWVAQPKDFGCTKSHLQAYDYGYYRGDEYFFVIEDDLDIRLDAMLALPTLDDVLSIDFDVLYMTGHWAKGGTKTTPRRIAVKPGLVRGVGVHTLVCRLISRPYVPFLMDQVLKNVRAYGFGVDRTDATLQPTRKRTFALEHHIGGHASADTRSWEPRVVDHYTAAASAIVHGHPGWTDEDEAATRAKVAYASRRKHWTVVDGSVRTIAALCEGVLQLDGDVRAITAAADRRAIEGRACDRLPRYVAYDTLRFCSEHEDADEPSTGLFIEHKNGGARSMSLLTREIGNLDPDAFALIMGNGFQHDGYMRKIRRTLGDTGLPFSRLRRAHHDLWWVLREPLPTPP